MAAPGKRSNRQALARWLSVMLLALHVFGQLGHHRQHESAAGAQPTGSCSACAFSAAEAVLPPTPAVALPVLLPRLRLAQPTAVALLFSRRPARASSRAPPSPS